MVKSVDELVESLNSIPPQKVALLNPPSFFLTDDKVFFSLGLLSLAGVLNKTHHEARVYDLAGDPNYLNQVSQIVKNNPADVYGITATSPQFSYATKVQEAIRKAAPSARVAVGGPHASTFFHLRQKRMLKDS